MSGDGRGHGPDLGSDEWKSVVEFKLGARGKADGQYLGRNERLTRHASSIEVIWGYQVQTLQCSLRP